MSLTDAVAGGIRSATYNEAADKADKETKEKAKAAAKKFRDYLTLVRKGLEDAEGKKEVSIWGLATVKKLSDDAGKYLTDNPNATAEQIEQYQNNFLGQVGPGFADADKIVQQFGVFRTFYPALGTKLLAEKQINASQKKQLDELGKEFGTYYDKVNASPTKYTIEDIQKMNDEFKTKAAKLTQDNKELQGQEPEKVSVQEAKAVEQTAEKIDEADKAEFSLKRMLSKIGSTAVQVFFGFLILVLMLLGGTLAANDAIGRPLAFRILYFIYGCLGFFVVIPYYIFRYFKDDSPHIYTLLPLTTSASESDIGRFFFAPFTYKEDAFAKEATLDYIRQAAILVGKPAPGMSSNVGKVLDAALSKIKELAVKGADTAESVAEQTQQLTKRLGNLEVGSAV